MGLQDFNEPLFVMNNFICIICKVCLSGVIPYQQHVSSESHIRKATLKQAAVSKPEKTLYCDICIKLCNSAEQLRQHNASPAHKNKERKAADLLERLGGQVDTVQNLNSLRLGDGVHLLNTSQVSVKNLFPAQPSPINMDNTPINPFRGPNGEAYIMKGGKGFCYVCRIDLTSSQHYQQHIAGNKHIKKERETAEGMMNFPIGNGNLAKQDQGYDLKNREPNGKVYDKIGQGGRCYICAIDFTSVQHASQHLAGAKHKKAASAPVIPNALLIGSEPAVTIDTGRSGNPSEMQKFQATHNTENAGAARLITTTQSSAEGRNARGPNGESFIMRGSKGCCFVCNLELTSESHAQAHVNGRKHQKKCWNEEVEPLNGGLTFGTNLNKVLMCSLCRVPFSCIANAEEHFMSERHKRKAEAEEFSHRKAFNSHSERANCPTASGEQDETGYSTYDETIPMKLYQESRESSVSRVDLENISSGYSSDINIHEKEVPLFESQQMGTSAQVTPVSMVNHIPTNVKVTDTRLSDSASDADLEHQDANLSNTSSKLNGIQNSSVISTLGLGIAETNEERNSHSASGTESKHRNDMVINTIDKLNIGQNDNLATNLSKMDKLMEKDLQSQVHATNMPSQNHTNISKMHNVGENNLQSPVYTTSMPSLDDNCQQSHDQNQFEKGGLKEETFENNVAKVEPQPLGEVHIQQDKQHVELNQLSQYQPALEENQTRRQTDNYLVPVIINGSRGYCHLCGVDLTSSQNIKQHLNGQKHQKKLAQWKITQTLQNRVITPPMLPGMPNTNNTPLNSVLSAGKFPMFVPDVQLVNDATGQRGFSSWPVERSADLQAILNGTIAPARLPGMSNINNAPLGSALGAVKPPLFAPDVQIPNAATDQRGSSSCPMQTSDLQTILRLEKKSYYFDGNRGVCYACSIELTSFLHTQQHINGRPHKRSENRFFNSQSGIQHPLSCVICNKSFTGQESAQQHFSSSKHKAKEELINESNSPLFFLDGGRVIQKDGQKWYVCDVCQKPLNTMDQFEFHKTSAKHIRESESRQAREITPTNTTEIRAENGSPALSVVRGVEGQIASKEDIDSKYSRKNMEDNGNNVFEKKQQEGILKHEQESGTSQFPAGKRQDDFVRQQVLEENRHHLMYGETPVTSPWELAQVSRRTSSILKGSTSNEITDFRRPILGAGTSQVDVPGNALLERNSMPTERYGVQMSSSPLVNSSRYNGQFNTDMLHHPSVCQSSWGALSTNLSTITRGLHDPNYTWTQTSLLRSNTTSGGTSCSASSKTCESVRSCTGETATQGDNWAIDGACGGAGSTSCEQQIDNCGNGGLQFMVKPGPVRTNRSHSQVFKKDRLSIDKKENDEDEFDDDMKDISYNINNEEQGLACKQGQFNPEPDKPFRNMSEFRYSCPDCKQYMNTMEAYTSHVKGKRHMYMMSTRQAPVRQLERICKTDTDAESITDRAFNLNIKDDPRLYQIELTQKAMAGDKIIYLPTGTGKTLVAVLTMALMLEKNRSRPVLFLVDKVLLVLQQANYIKTQLSECEIIRPDLENENKYIKRKLEVKAICGGLSSRTELPVWKHDIIVTTAAFCTNMLQSKMIRWEDFSLVVLDEVHHCHKGHPYLKLMALYHNFLPNESRAKVLGLTASPAGKSTVQQTYIMLQNLFSNLGGAGIAIVQAAIRPLQAYQSSAKIHAICVMMSNKEVDFKRSLLVYFILCFTKLVSMSGSLERKKSQTPISYFIEALNKPRDLEVATKLANQFLEDEEPLTDILREVGEAQCSAVPNDAEYDAQFLFLKTHIQEILLAIPEIGSCLNCTVELLNLFKPSTASQVLEGMDLPCSKMFQRVKNFEKDGEKDATMYNKLVATLRDPTYIDWLDESNKALVLVRERKSAKQYSLQLRTTDLIEDRKLFVHRIVGHGKGAQDGGMDVKKQKKVLDNQDKYHIFVATSIMEEGVDFSALQLVVCMNPPTSLRALVQMRGRARKQGSHFVVLCSSKEEVDKLISLQQQEINMQEAALQCLKEESAQK